MTKWAIIFGYILGVHWHDILGFFVHRKGRVRRQRDDQESADERKNESIIFRHAQSE